MRVNFAVPGDLSSRTGANSYNGHILGLMTENGIAMNMVSLPARLPLGVREDLAEASATLVAHAGDGPLLIDSAGFSCLSVEQIRPIRTPIFALVHHPLSLENGLSPEMAEHFRRTEKAALSFAKAIIVTSAYTGRVLVQDFDVPGAKITVAEPGTAHAPRALGGSGSPLQLLAAGSLIPRKGYDVLLDALGGLLDLDWHLTLAGSPHLDPFHAAHISRRIEAEGLSSRITQVGEIPPAELDKLYAGTDIFVMPSLFEGFGMALTEAMIRGLPIVCTTGGACAETVPHGVGLKVAPGNASAFRAALRYMLSSVELRRDMAKKSWAYGQSLPGWADSARKIAELIKRAT